MADPAKEVYVGVLHWLRRVKVMSLELNSVLELGGNTCWSVHNRFGQILHNEAQLWEFLRQGYTDKADGATDL